MVRHSLAKVNQATIQDQQTVIAASKPSQSGCNRCFHIQLYAEKASQQSKWLSYPMIRMYDCHFLFFCANLNQCQEICPKESSKRPRRELTIFGLGPQALLQHPENLSRGRIFGKKIKQIFV